MEHKDKIQMILIRNNASKYLEDFINDIENSPLRAYEDLSKARNSINKIIDRMFNKSVED